MRILFTERIEGASQRAPRRAGKGPNRLRHWPRRAESASLINGRSSRVARCLCLVSGKQLMFSGVSERVPRPLCACFKELGRTKRALSVRRSIFQGPSSYKNGLWRTAERISKAFFVQKGPSAYDGDSFKDHRRTKTASGVRRRGGCDVGTEIAQQSEDRVADGT